MLQHKTRITFITVAALLIIIVLGFTGGLNITSFKKSYTGSLVASYSVVGHEYVRKIEYAIAYGKPLDNFFGMQQLLEETKQGAQGIENIRIISKEGRIIYSLEGKLIHRKLPAKFLEQIELNSKDAASNAYLSDHNQYHIFLPIRDRRNDRIGSMELLFDQALVNSRTQLYIRQIIRYSLILWCLALLVLTGAIYRFHIVSKEGEINPKLILTIFVVVLGLTQVGYGWINYNVFQKLYTDVAREYTSKTAQIICNDINQVISKGVTYRDLYHIEGWLQRFITAAPEIERIDIRDARNHILYSTRAVPGSNSVDSRYLYNLPLNRDSYQTRASLRMILSRSYIHNKLTTIALDMLTILLTSFLFMFEVTLFCMIFFKTPQNVQSAQSGTDIMLIRPLGFMFFFSAFMSLSFIPILMKNLYRPMFGLSQNVILGLPTSAELLCGAIATLMAGYCLERIGWKPAFLWGLGFFLLGSLLSGLAGNAATFIVARGTVGIGYGFCLVSMLGFANSLPNPGSNNEAVSFFNAGTYAGINCGCASGAMLAERIGYSNIFYVAAAIAILSGIFAFLCLKNRRIQGAGKKAGLNQSGRNVLGFFLNIKVATFFIFVVLPLATCTMFLDFFLPLYSRTVGVSTADLGRVFLLNGVAIVYLGPVVSKYAGKYLGVHKSVILTAVLFAVALLVFAGGGNFLAAFVSAFLLGVAVG
ncbi:MAG TPA: hypothetical protein DDW65_03775, partial [Firmicutes bacterium]|nr:hypothetical protein [Bacillota bacterium]